MAEVSINNDAPTASILWVNFFFILLLLLDDWYFLPGEVDINAGFSLANAGHGGRRYFLMFSLYPMSPPVGINRHCLAEYLLSPKAWNRLTQKEQALATRPYHKVTHLNTTKSDSRISQCGTMNNTCGILSH
jgi:hypothetical protein